MGTLYAPRYEAATSSALGMQSLPPSSVMPTRTLNLIACLQNVLKPLDVQQTKDLETTVAGIRADKVKEKTASDAAKKGESTPTDGKKPTWILHVAPIAIMGPEHAQRRPFWHI